MKYVYSVLVFSCLLYDISFRLTITAFTLLFVVC